ncbi:MAG: ATP-binding cassette domain-containing protein [Pseudomonadota bacterium]|nr:ATP-binding cassette domain-containing protein [Pseudomonadota bacterium]
MINEAIKNVSVSTHPFDHSHQVQISLCYGEAVKLSGKNGSGKTTILKTLSGHYIGQLKLEDMVVRPFYISEQPLKIEGLTVFEQLGYYENLYGSQKKYWPWLDDILTRRVVSLSRGQLQRLSLNRLAYSTACVWLLDEPFNGLDTQSVCHLNQYIDDHLSEGGGVLYTSHVNARSQDRCIVID